ncbi:MAG: hypothetical protein CMI05_02545 [Oceanospirillaceae bacterium]|nr:hypothetical protein [Oceanospirillaceae bacterium]
MIKSFKDDWLSEYYWKAVNHRKIQKAIEKSLQRKLGNLRISPKHLRLTERFKFKATITDMLVACRKLLTTKLDRSGSPIGWTLN